MLQEERLPRQAIGEEPEHWVPHLLTIVYGTFLFLAKSSQLNSLCEENRSPEQRMHRPSGSREEPLRLGETIEPDPPSKRVEKRRETRYNLGAPVSFTWKDHKGAFHRGDGFTRDISVSGFFILTDTPPPTEAPVQTEIIFPSLEGDSTLHLRSEGRVLRVELQSGDHARCGFAAESKTFALRSSGTDRAN